MYVFIPEGDMTDILKHKWLTVLADGILTEVRDKHPGFQLVQATGYGVKDFVDGLANGTIHIRSSAVALCVGNEQLIPGCNINIARQIENLIRQIWILKPTMPVLVSSLLPKPTQETLMQPLVVKNNQGISAMCRRLNKYGTATVTYMPLHQGFLEKHKYKDEKTGVMKVTMRVIQPHGIFFKLGTDLLNVDGIAFYLAALEEKAAHSLGRPARPGLDVGKLRGLRVQIVNDTLEESQSHLGQKLNKGLMDAQRHPLSEQKPKPGECGQQGPCGAKQTQGKRKKSSDVLEMEAGGQIDRQNKKKVPVKEGKRKVAGMVEKWERLSQGPSIDDIDRELGEESIVRVNLGDEPSEVMDSRRSDEMMRL